MISQEAKKYPFGLRGWFRCDFADVLVPVLRELNGRGKAVVSDVEDNIATIRAPLSLMNQVFLEVERRLERQGYNKPIPPILL